jgi:hypothetical protein
LKIPCIHHVSEKKILVGQSAKIDAFAMDTREQLAREKHHHSDRDQAGDNPRGHRHHLYGTARWPLPHSARRVVGRPDRRNLDAL